MPSQLLRILSVSHLGAFTSSWTFWRTLGNRRCELGAPVGTHRGFHTCMTRILVQKTVVWPFCPITFDSILTGPNQILCHAVLAETPGAGGSRKKKKERKGKHRKFKFAFQPHTWLHTCPDACTPHLAHCPTPALHLDAIHKTARVCFLTQSRELCKNRSTLHVAPRELSFADVDVVVTNDGVFIGCGYLWSVGHLWCTAVLVALKTGLVTA